MGIIIRAIIPIIYDALMPGLCGEHRSIDKIAIMNNSIHCVKICAGSTWSHGNNVFVYIDTYTVYNIIDIKRITTVAVSRPWLPRTF
jgi:hypothetical protein